MARRNFPGRPSHKNKREILKFYGQDDNTITENRNRNIERNWTHFYEVFGSSDDEDEFEGFHSSAFHRKVFSKYKSENKAVCDSKKKFDFLSVESEVRRSKLGMRSLARKSYDKMIKDGLSGLWRSENILNNNIIFNEAKKPLKDNAVSSDKIPDNSRSSNKKELQTHKESSNFYFQCNQQKCSGESASKTLIKNTKNQIEKTITNKNSQEENEDSLLKIKPENNSEKIIMQNNEINKKDNILPVKKKRYSFPDISVRSSQRITQRKRILEECDKNTITKKETFEDPSKENQISSLPSPKPVLNKKSITKHKPRYISYEWVPVRSLGTLEQPLVVDGKRKWKPSLKVQTNCDPHKTRRKKYNRLSMKVKKQSLRFSSLYSRGIRKRRKHKSPWGLRRCNKSDKKGQIFDTKFHKNFLCETNEKSAKASSIVNSDSKKTTSNNYDNINSNFQQDQISFKHEILKEEENSEELNNLLWKEGQTTGTVICAVCKQIKFYVHMKRRYGQFCCDACSKFFTWFLRKPEQFYCTSDGCCDFSPVLSVEKGLSSSQFCKACWIKVCLEKFIVPIYTRKKLADFMPKFQQNAPPPSVFSDKEVKSTESSQVAQRDLKISNNLLQNSFDKLSSNIKNEIEEKPIKQSTCNFEFEDSTDIEIELDESLISELEKICDETTNKINLSDNETEAEKLPLTFDDKLDECLNEKLSENIDNRNSSENENSHKLNLSDIETFNKEILIKETKLQSENATSIDASDKMVSSESFHLFPNERKDSQNNLLIIDEKPENEQFSLNLTTETAKTQNIEEKSSNDLDSVLYKGKHEEDIIPSVVTKLNDHITSERKKSQLLFRRKHYRSLKRKDSSKSSLSVSKTLLNRKSLKKRDETDVTFTKLRKNLEVNDELKIADDENYPPEIEVQTKKGPRIKHVCRRASVVFGYPIAAFEKSLKEDDFNLSALPKEEKQKILENDANSPDVDDLPLDELIRRASEKDTKDVIIIRKSEKLDTPNKSPNNQIKNGLKSSISKENSVRFRKVRCKCCEGCKAVDCEKCVFCLDKKKFGGSNLMRKACINRRCRRPQMPSYPHRSIGLKKRQLLNESNQEISEMKGAIIYNSNELNDNYITVESSNDQKTEMLQKQKEYKAWKKSSAAKTCLVFVNYWEEYDPERLLNQGFPLISSEMLAVKFVCYLCGSAGLDDQFQFIFCSLCCEPFHSFCLDEETFNDRFNEETWCCERCQSCIVCGLKENLMKCKVCMKYYHLDCIGPDYPSKPSKKNIWVCPTCMKCKSCSGTIQKGSFWNFDLPYCSKCSLRKTKGSYCPICQQNYDDNDYESKMMQCAKCHLWVHAKCDDITDDMYEILSCLPESVVYTCPCCAQEVECMWLNAVFDELNRGLKSILSAFVNAEIINNSINHQEDIGPQLEYPKFPDLFQRKHCEIRLPPGLHNNTDGKTDNLVDILNKLEKKEYTTLTNFYEEVLALPQLNNVSRPHKVDKLNKLIKLYFPWFEHSHWDKHLSDSSNCHVVNPPYDDHNYAIHNISSVLKESLTQPGKLRDGKNDPRKCVLCGISGDALPIECGRLIYCGQNDWVHVNCALWSAEVFEEIDGSLQNVHPAISRGRSMRCESCNNKGATVGCCIRGCPANYHFKCARDEKAIFQEDKKVYCANHSNRVDEKQVSDDSFFVKHSMYVDQDQLSPKWRKKTWQSGLPAGCVHITIGSLTIENLGYLTPASDRAEALVPVDFIATRLFWSTKNPRQRITYRIRTIEVIPETEKVEKVISRHHTIAHNIDKTSLNKIDKRNKTTNFWKFRGSNLKRNNSHSDYKLESLETQVDQKKKIMDQNSESSLSLKNVVLDSNQENNSVQDLSDNTCAITDKFTRILNSSEKEENLFHNSVSKKNLNTNQSFLSNTKQLDLKFQKLPLSENKLISPPKIKDFQSEKKEIDNITSEKNDTTKSDSNIYSSKNDISNERNWNKPEENEISNSEHLESVNKINNQILESKINNKCKNVVESKNENNIYHSDDPQLPLEEVENICPKLPERKCSIKKKILKTYPLRSRRYQESVKLLKHYVEKNDITINSKKKLKQKKCKEISFPSTNISEMCDDNNNEAEIHVENANKSRQLRRTPARLYFEHLTKHKLLFKRKKNLNNIFNKKSNCTNHKKNKINCSKNSEFLPNSKNHLYQMPIDFAVQKNNNLNNLVNNEIVVAVGEIENFSYCVDSKETEIQSNERFTDCKKDFNNDETFKCKNCKRQYRTQDSCRKHEINCNFIVDSSSTDEEDIDMISKSQDEKTNMNNENKCYLNTVEMDDDDDNDDGDDDDDKQSVSSMDSAPLSEVCSGYNNNNLSEQFTYPNSSTSEIHSENSFQQNIANFNLENNKKKESNQKFILPKPNINVVNSYTSTVSESMFNITENSMLVFNQPDETTPNLNTPYIISNQADLNTARPVCIQNTCQLFTAGLNIVQNPNLSYLGSITISNQELVSMAFNVQDSPVQMQSGIIMDQVQTSQIASNVQLPIMNFPVINPSLPNPQTFVSHPTIMNSQQPFMYLNPVLTQTQVSESVFIMNSESSQPVLYGMPGNTVTQSPLQTSGFIANANNFNSTNLEQSWLTNSSPNNNVHSSVDMTSTSQNSIEDFSDNSEGLLQKNISTETDSINEDKFVSNGEILNTVSKINLKRSVSPKNSEKSKNVQSSKCNSTLSELQKLTSNKPLIEVIQKAAQQMLKLTYKSYSDNNQKDNTEEARKSEKPCSTMKSCTTHPRTKYKTARIRRNSTSSENDFSTSNATSGKTSRRSSVQDDVNENISLKNSEEKNHPSNKPYIMFEISNEDGLCIKSPNIDEAWKNVLDQVQDACTAAHVKRKNISQNGVDGLSVMGLTNNAVRYILEQLPGAKNCVNYNFLFHPPHPEEEELPLNPTGSARSEPFLNRKDYDMFNFLASKHRCPPQYQPYLRDEEMKHKSSRRATSIDLPMAMRFRHLKNSAKEAVGVYRSQIHGRGLFCKRNIDAGEMIIEYAGEVIRSILTDSREAYYESKGIGCYMFRIDDNEVVDATMHGNAARFINHSCEPNCYSKVINVDGKKHIVIFALKRILKGEELTYNYKFPIEDEKIPCTCGSKRCRKYLN